MHLSFFLYIIFSHIYSCFSLYLSFFVYCVHPNLCTSSSVSIYAGILIPIFISLCTRSCHYKIVVILGSTQGNHLSKFQLIRNSCFEVNRQQTNKQTDRHTNSLTSPCVWLQYHKYPFNMYRKCHEDSMTLLLSGGSLEYQNWKGKYPNGSCLISK